MTTIKIEVSDELYNDKDRILNACNKWLDGKNAIGFKPIFNQQAINEMIVYVNNELNPVIPLIQSHSRGHLYDCYGQYDLITLKGQNS